MIWEVKTANWYPISSLRQRAIDQLNRYVANLPGSSIGWQAQPYDMPYQQGVLLVDSKGIRGLLWYQYEGRSPTHQPRPVPVLGPDPILVPAAQTGPRPWPVIASGGPVPAFPPGYTPAQGPDVHVPNLPLPSPRAVKNGLLATLAAIGTVVTGIAVGTFD